MTGTWKGLANQPAFHTSTMFLLTDGRVMVQEEATPHWHALTPDASGSYVNGTWSTLADMSIWRRYYASGTTKDGRVIVIGGEQSGGGGDTNRGEIYDPVADAWTPIPPPPGWVEVGDASCCLLPEGKLLVGAIHNTSCAIYDPATNTWSTAANMAMKSNEETWVLLPDETILTVECFPRFRAQKYVISSNVWKDEGLPPVELVDPDMSEIGPAMLTYDGRVVCFGAANSKGHGKTALYTLPATPGGTGTWVAGPDIPKVGEKPIVCNDCPASLMPNGKVLFAAAPYVLGDWGKPIYIFEFDPVMNTITQAPTPPNNAHQVYWSRFILLPTGEVMFGPSTNDLQVYLPDGAPREAWRPTITDVTSHCAGGITDYYLVRGTQLNGFSQANVYGDDCNASTNYPVARLRSVATGQVRFCRTHDFSTMAVATGALPESVRFDARGLPDGEYDLCVIANGISSHCVRFCHGSSCCPCGQDCGHRGPRGCHGHEAGCDCGKAASDPRVEELTKELQRLRNDLQRLVKLVPVKEPVRQPKERKRASRGGDKAPRTRTGRRR